MRSIIGAAICFALVLSFANAFSTLGVRTKTRIPPFQTILKSAVPADVASDVDSSSFILPPEKVHPLFSVGKDGKKKSVNLYGIWCLLVSLVTFPVWKLAMKVTHMLKRDVNRSLYDKTGKIWAKVWLRLLHSYPKITGNLTRLKAGDEGGACLFVANHASFFDIPVLCTVLDPVFKFIAKTDLTKIPCVGSQLIGGEHILIDREDRKSQLKTVKQGLKWLKKGVPLMAFPEGRRSKDGRLMEFKGGLFLMAKKAKCPIVPITLSHTHAIYPESALFPVQPGSGKLRVHVHDPIDAEGKTEDELAELVKSSFLETLPLEQHPLTSAEDTPNTPGEGGTLEAWKARESATSWYDAGVRL